MTIKTNHCNKSYINKLNKLRESEIFDKVVIGKVTLREAQVRHR